MSDFYRYFRQQQELFGDVLYLESMVEARSHGIVQDLMTTGELFVPEPARDAVHHAWQAATTLDELYRMVHTCTNCQLGYTRRNFVFGVGNPNADVVLIGEAPGAEEDAKGEPFVGRAGQLLNKMLEAIDLKREEVYICNILKCRPPNNRDPLSAEVGECEPYLHHQLKLIHPKIMLALGRIAAQTLLRTADSLTALRSRVHAYQGIPLLVTYHPAALLRNPHWKRPTWEDLQRFQHLYDELKKQAEPPWHNR